jgi:hypothetical protein
LLQNLIVKLSKNWRDAGGNAPAANVQEAGGGKVCDKRKKPAANANYNDTPPSFCTSSAASM